MACFKVKKLQCNFPCYESIFTFLTDTYIYQCCQSKRNRYAQMVTSQSYKSSTAIYEREEDSTA
jgi:hypothetical protein